MFLDRTFAVPALRFAVSLAGALGVLLPSPALADIMLYPTRVVVEGAKRSAQVEIINRGQEAETYRIGIVNRRMTELGEIVPVEAAIPGEQFADEMVRYTPRQVTLQPGASQTIRISVRKPADLAAGEYRSHLQFDRIADAAGLADLASAAAEPASGVSIVLQTLIGASIPVIVRHGETSASVTLDSLQLEPGRNALPPELSFTFRREGNRSVFGDLVATYAAPGKAPIEIGGATGVAVYVPNAERKARLPLTLPDGVILQGGEIRVRYNERADAGGALIAEATIGVP
jgi:hypothetical protein